MNKPNKRPVLNKPIRITKTNGEIVEGALKAGWHSHQYNEKTYHKGYQELDVSNVESWEYMGDFMEFTLHESKNCLDDRFIKINARGYSDYVESTLSKGEVIEMARFLEVTSEDLGI